MLNGFRQTKASISHNTKTKHYPNDYQRVTVASDNVYFEKGWENIEKKERVIPTQYDMDGESRSDSIRRAKEAVFDIVALNSFDYFVTLTLSPDKVDRKDTEAVQQKLKSWLNNMRNRQHISYVLVAELHKSGAIHFHALISGDLKLVDSGTVKHDMFGKPVKIDTLRRQGIPLDKAETVYNVKNWSLGHSTATKIYGNQIAIAKYLTKYITKDFQRIFGNFYFAGGNINRKAQITLSDSDFEMVDSKEYVCKATGVKFKYLEVAGGVVS